MSPPYDNHGSSRSRRGVWSHWVPLAITLTVATAGLAAWVWSQRKESAEDHAEPEPDLDYEHADYGENPAYGASAEGRRMAPPEQRDGNYAAGAEMDEGASGWGSRMTSAFSSNPQTFLDSTGKTVAAGVAAAGAAVGKALASIREEDKPEPETNPWSENREVRREKGPAPVQKKRKTVAIVISADSQFRDDDDDITHEHASILNHIPRLNDLSAIKLFVLIYAPSLKETGEAATSNRPPPSVSSSFSNVGYDQAQTPEAKSPVLGASAENTLFNAVYSQALALVDKETMILPFTTPNGHTHILRHLQPDVIYLQESLAGENGGYVANMQTWFRHDIVLVVGAEDGSGGLADSESETEKADKPDKWWQKPERVGRGRGIIVVDSVRVNDDWVRRVQGRE
ncbi:hypothetical protein HDV57DRAFT_500531 [Trichoderma longibrachiatum]|uniref:Peroxin 22-like protein n=1 Tax=Trichoderma longibrachiatum ATCC 18648 TaxID=983965 RepID=A0A2T4BRX0_TRILO|nr:hypothetical protein M440DRAFT_1364104 [Trichoderma longibrachiatum ATCC 18648]